MIVIVDYGMGNLHSVYKALHRLNAPALISSSPKDIERADKLILPGVGHFKKGMENLKALGLLPVLNKKVLEEKTPILGICLGIQLFTKNSEEGDVPGLSWIDAETIRFNLKNLKIPHMGWNSIDIKKSNPLLLNMNSENKFYFVHSYHVVPKDKSIISSTSNYETEFVSSVNKDNIFGVQFHPEKSHSSGLSLLKNFMDL